MPQIRLERPDYLDVPCRHVKKSFSTVRRDSARTLVLEGTIIRCDRHGDPALENFVMIWGLVAPGSQDLEAHDQGALPKDPQPCKAPILTIRPT